MKKYMVYAVGTATVSIILYGSVITFAELAQYKIPFIASLFSLGCVSFLLVCEVMRGWKM